MKPLKRGAVKSISIDLIDGPEHRSRLEIDPEHIKELAASIQQVGLMQPISINKKGDRFEIIAGECRFLAHKLLKMETIGAHVGAYTPTEVRLLRAIENLNRRDLTIIEEAKQFKELHDDLGLSWEDIAVKVSKSPALVKRRYDLLKMPDILIAAMHLKEISYTVAEQLHRLRDVNRVEYFLQYAVENGATRDVVRRWIDEEEQSIRQAEHAGASGGGYQNPLETKPVFLACDLCIEAVKLGDESMLRICPSCRETIRKNM